ncbi:MAG: nitronate monooxygenase [bacterium]
MFRTRVTEMLGIEYPIVCGCMMHLSSPSFVAAVSEAGCLGLVASAMWKTKEEFRDALKEVKRATRKPFGVNLNLFPAMRPIDNSEYLEVLLDEGVRIVETSGHKAPEDLAARFKEAGLTWIHKCVGLRYARKAVSLGADIITVVGYENGGATGVLDIGTFVLIPTVARAVSVPVIGGGGVSDGSALVAALSLGAQGVIMGTRFLCSDECPIHPRLKEALVNAQETDTVIVMRTLGNSHRVWKNAASERVLGLESDQASLQEIIDVAAGTKARMMYEQGDLDQGVLSCGQGVGLVRDVKPVRQIVQEIMEEARLVVGRIAA